MHNKTNKYFHKVNVRIIKMPDYVFGLAKENV